MKITPRSLFFFSYYQLASIHMYMKNVIANCNDPSIESILLIWENYHRIKSFYSLEKSFHKTSKCIF